MSIVLAASSAGQASRFVKNLVVDYGADPTGSADSTTAINAWAAAGGNLYCPPGTYLHNGATRPKITVDGTFMWGVPGASIITSSILYDGTPAKDIDLFVIGNWATGAETTNITVQGMTFKFTGLFPNRGGGACLRVSRVNNLRISNCRFQYGSYGLHINRAHRFWILDNEIRDTKGDGLQCNNGWSGDNASMTIQDGWIVGNKMITTGDDAIAVGGVQDGGVFRSQPTNVHVLDNNIDTTGIGGGVGIYGLKGGTVARNKIRNPAGNFVSVRCDTSLNQYPSADISVLDNDGWSDLTATGTGGINGPVCMWLGNRNVAASGSELNIPLAQNIRIERNRFVVSDRSGIYCQPHTGFQTDLPKWLSKIVIRDNEFIFTGTPPAIDYRGLSLSCINDLEIRGNRIEGFPHYAANINWFTGLRFNDNHISDCLGNATYAADDMVLIGNASIATDTITEASGNTYRKTSGTANRIVNIKATGSTTYPYASNRFHVAGATITTATETTDGKGQAGTVALDATGHLPPSLMPVGPRAIAITRRSLATAETFPRMGATLGSQSALVSGQQQFVAITLLAGMTITSIVFYSGGTALAAGTNQWFGLWDSSRNQLRLTSDDGANAWAANAEKSLNLTTPYVISADGLYYLSCMVAGGTLPTLIGVASSGAHLGAAPVLGGRDQTNTGLTTPATAPATAATLASAGVYLYAYVK